MNMKKAFAVMLAMSLTCSLAACGQDSDKDKSVVDQSKVESVVDAATSTTDKSGVDTEVSKVYLGNEDISNFQENTSMDNTRFYLPKEIMNDTVSFEEFFTASMMLAVEGENEENKESVKAILEKPILFESSNTFTLMDSSKPIEVMVTTMENTKDITIDNVTAYNMEEFLNIADDIEGGESITPESPSWIHIGDIVAKEDDKVIFHLTTKGEETLDDGTVNIINMSGYATLVVKDGHASVSLIMFNDALGEPDWCMTFVKSVEIDTSVIGTAVESDDLSVMVGDLENLAKDLDDPENPDVTEEPENPDVTEDPENPDVAEEPENPNVTDDPENVDSTDDVEVTVTTGESEDSLVIGEDVIIEDVEPVGDESIMIEVEN